MASIWRACRSNASSLSPPLIAKRWGLTRGELDEFSVRSHQRAAAATASGLFADEIVPVETGDGEVVTDQGIRGDSTVERLATLPTPFVADGVVTAGSASQISDGAAAVLMMTSARAAELGLAIKSVNVARPTLDDVFMKYTGSSIRDVEQTDHKATNRVVMQVMTGGRR